MKTKQLALFCTVAFSLTAISCRPQVVVNGVSMEYDAAAQATYDDAKATLAQGDVPGTLAKLDALVAQFPKSDIAPQALATIAHLAKEQGEVARARTALERLLMEHPRSELCAQARMDLAQMDIDNGRPQDAVAPLKTAYDDMPDGSQKREIASTLAATLDASGDVNQAAHWYAKAYTEAQSDDERQQILARMHTLVDGRLSFKDVRLLAEEIDPASPLGELVQYKLARIYCHLRDFSQCHATLKNYLQIHPQGHFLRPAQELEARLNARMTVNPSVVGVLLPLSGQFKVYGARALAAIRQGAELVEGQSKGGISLVVRDSGGDPEQAAAAFEDLALKEHAVVVIGALLQNTALAAALKAQDLGVPLLSFSRRQNLCEMGPQVFRLGLSNRKQAKALVDLTMGKLGMTRFAILYPRHAYGMELMNDFWDEVDAHKGMIVGAEAYDHDETTFVEPIKRLVGRSPLYARSSYIYCANRAKALPSSYARNKALEKCRTGLTPIVDFDALLIPDDSRAVGLIAPTLAFEDVITTGDEDAIEDYRKTTGNSRVKPVQLIGANGWNTQTLVERGGKYVRGALFVDGFNPASSEPLVQKFVQDFGKSQGSAPTIIEAQAFDGGKLVAAILRPNPVPGAKAVPQDRQAMQRRLAEVKDFPGVTGLISFDADGESVTPLTVFTINKDMIEVADLDSKPAG